MIRFLLKRLVSSVAVLLAISVLAYLLIFMTPGDPAAVIVARQIGQWPTPEQVDQFRAETGMDAPLIVQYMVWLGNAVRGDFGNSIRSGEPVADEILMRIGPTVLLAGVATFFTVLVGIPTGFLAAWRENSFWDHVTRTGALVGVSIPNFWLAFLLILLFSIHLRWLPTHGIGGPENLVLPVICISVAYTARLSRLTRSGFLEVQHEEYILGARARGMKKRAVWFRHALPNITVPLITLIATQFSFIVAGSVIIETLFAWPGIGNYYITAVNFRDIPVIQALLVLFGTVFILVNLIADLAYAAIDPRIRLK